MIREYGWVIETPDGSKHIFSWVVDYIDAPNEGYDFEEIARKQDRYVKLPDGMFLTYNSSNQKVTDE